MSRRRAIPVTILDFAFVLWIYMGLTNIKVELTKTNQEAKLDMYNRLTWVILANIGLWFAASLMWGFTVWGKLPLSWKSQFFVSRTIFDLNFLLVLAAIAFIWRPGPESFNYSVYTQSAGNEADAEAGPDGPDGADGGECGRAQGRGG